MWRHSRHYCTLEVVLLIVSLTLISRKNCLTQFNTRIYWITSSAASHLFHMFTQSVKTYIFHCHILRSTDVWKRWFIKQTQNERLLLSASFTANFELVFDLTEENAFLRGFNLKSTERALKMFFWKTILRIFKIILRLKDRYVFMWQSLEILNVFSAQL